MYTFFFQNTEGRPCSATIDFPNTTNRDLVKDVITDFSEAEQLPPSTSTHLRCAMLSLLQEEDEAVASIDFVPQSDVLALVNSHRSATKQGSRRATESEILFQQAFYRAVSNHEHLETLAHMENMYAAAVQDLWLAQESTATRHNAWVANTLHTATENGNNMDSTNTNDGNNNNNNNNDDDNNSRLPPMVGPGSLVDETHLRESAALVQQYATEIKQTKVEQREGFREFVLVQDQDHFDSQNTDNQNSDDQDDAKKFNIDSTTSTLSGNESQRRRKLIDHELFGVMVRQGLPAIFKKNQTFLQNNIQKNKKEKDMDKMNKNKNKDMNMNMDINNNNNSSGNQTINNVDFHHLASHTTERLVRFVTCFGQQRKSTVDIELICPSNYVTSMGPSLPSMFVYSNDPDLGMSQRKENAKRVCSNDCLNALILPTDQHGRMETSFVKLCHRATEFCFDDVNIQYQQGKQRRVKKRKENDAKNNENDAAKEMTACRGDAIVTKHTNLCGLHVVFHLLRDSDANNTNSTNGMNGTNGTNESTRLNSVHTVRDILSKSLRSIVKSAALSGASVLYIPYDLYSPLEAGFGTRDFVTLVRDTRATIMELIASQRKHTSKHQLKCVRFVKTNSKSNLLTSSLISVLQEQFASDIFHET